MSVDSSQIGIVKKYEDGVATVVMDVQGGCAGCKMHGVCGSDKQNAEHTINTDIELVAGDKVILYIDPSKRIFSALMLFIFPIVSLVIFYYIASLFLAEGFSILFGFVGLIVAFIINKVIDKVWGKKVAFIIAGKYEEDIEQ